MIKKNAKFKVFNIKKPVLHQVSSTDIRICLISYKISTVPYQVHHKFKKKTKSSYLPLTPLPLICVMFYGIMMEPGIKKLTP
jgi:hypothetical protein